MKKKRKILKENSCPIRSLFAKKDKKILCMLAQHAPKRDTNVRVTSFLVHFAAYRARVSGP